MASFFIDTATGQVATLRQLVEAGVADAVEQPPRPWHPIQGTRDASTMWYAVMRKQERGVFIGTLVLRHARPPCLPAASRVGRRSRSSEIGVRAS